MKAKTKNTPKVRTKSAAVQLAPAQITERIKQTLAGLALPTNSLCEPGNAVQTLLKAHSVMELLSAIDQAVEDGNLELPEANGLWALQQIRKTVQDAVKYSNGLCEGEDNLRGAFDSGRMELPAAQADKLLVEQRNARKRQVLQQAVQS
jgi:hypothetical protein